jgi:O-antigen ligase
LDATQESDLPDPRLYSTAERARYALPYPTLPRAGRLRRDWPLALLLAAVAFDATFTIAAANAHTPARYTDTMAIRAMVAAVPLAAAALAALAIFRPWPAFLAILLLTPLWDAAQISWSVGNFQVIMQTVFVVALGVGCLLSRSRGRTGERGAIAQDSASGHSAIRSLFRRWAPSSISSGVAGVAVVVFLALALASTLASPDFIQSRGVLVHGIVEPVAMGLILLGLRPNRTDLVLVAIALGVSAAIGSLLNILATVPGVTSLAELQARRLSFSLLTYNNVGLFGELLAMAVPLLIGVLLARRSLRLSASTLALLGVALVACLAGLFFTFSKSAWLATSIATTLLILLAARSWRSRAAIVLAAGLASTIVVPWPALVLQFTPTLDTAYRTVMVRIVGENRFDSWNPATVAGDGSVMFRVRTIEAGIDMAVAHPWLGVGLDEYHTYYLNGYAIPPVDSRIDHAHSIFPELAAELGIPAMALVVLIYAAALLALWQVYRNPPDTATRLLAATLMATIVSWIVVATAFGDDIYRSARNMSSEAIMMAVVVAAAFALNRYSHDAMVRLGRTSG